MKDEEIRELEQRRIPDELMTRTIQRVRRLEYVVPVLPKPRWRPFGYRCPRCGRKLRRSVTTVPSATFSSYRFRYTHWRCGPESFYLGGCGYEYGTVVTQVHNPRREDIEDFIDRAMRQG